MEKEKTTEEKGDMSAVYEVSYLLLPSLATEQVPAKVASLKEAIVKAGGTVISDEDPILVDLAYPMTKVVQTIRHKVKTGYFGWVKFEMTKDGVETVQKHLDTHPDVLRYLLINTVRENTLLHGHMMLKKEEEGQEEIDAPAEVAEESASPEEIDKSIDDLVIA